MPLTIESELTVDGDIDQTGERDDPRPGLADTGSFQKEVILGDVLVSQQIC